MVWIIIGATLLLAVWTWGWIANRPLRDALAKGDAQQIIAAIDRRSTAQQIHTYHRTIRMLWDGYQRETAIAVIRGMATRHDAEKITQYWLHQAIEIEPQLSLAGLEDAFLADHYRPEVAATCGSYG